MNVVYTFDDSYTDITMVSILSFLETNQEVEDIVIHIVDCGISERNLKRIEKLIAKYNRTMKVVKALDVEKRIPIKLEKGYWSLVCYVRLFFAEMLPDVDRIMHIDCDTIVRGNLQQIYQTDLDNCSCAMCYDCLPSAKYAAGFRSNEAYYSNGFIIFNLKYIRENSIEQKFVDYIVKKKGILPHLDQDAVSAVLRDSVYLLPPQYNVMSVSFALEERCTEVFDNHEPYYSIEEMRQALEQPLIVHFVGYRYYNRPWKQPCFHPYNREWINLYKRIEGYQEALIHTNCTLKKRIVISIWNSVAKLKIASRVERFIEVKRFRKKSRLFRQKMENV